MKTIKLIFQVILFLLISLTWACSDVVYQTYEANTPIYMSFDSLRTAVKSTSPKEFSKPGKIYLKGDYIFVNEYLKGIHVIDNSNPSSPQIVAFIEIPGNVDIAIKDNYLFADSYIDLVKIDISDIQNIKEIDRIKDIFFYTLPPVNENYPIANIDYSKGVVIDWEIKKITNEITPVSYPSYYDYSLNNVAFSSDESGATQNTIGTGGSMARFAATSTTLYTVANSQLTVINLADNNFSIVSQNYIAWNVETIFINGDKLFFGTPTGMLIYDISVPLVPSYFSEYTHILSCDPVVVKDTIAYVSLRTGSACGGTVNRLDVISLSTLKEPQILHSASMVNPYGLGISDTLLFVCDGIAGLKIYNVAKPLEFENHKIAEFSDIFAYDVIPHNNVLMLIGENGLVQYDYSNPLNIKELSSIGLK